MVPALQELRQAGGPGSCFKEGVQASGSWGHGVCRYPSGQREVKNGAVGESTGKKKKCQFWLQMIHGDIVTMATN